MKQVRILKSGSHDGVCYNEGEIWDYVSDYTKDRMVKVQKDGKRVVVSIVNDSSYGKEAEFIEEEPNNLNLIL